jgi:hypothetical protein
MGWSLLGGRKCLCLPQLRVTMSSGSQSSQEWAYRPEDQVRTRQWNCNWTLVNKLSLSETNTSLEVPVSWLSGGPEFTELPPRL